MRILGLLVLLGMESLFTGLRAAPDGVGGGSGNTWLVRLAEEVDPAAYAAQVGADYAGPLAGVARYHRFVFREQLAAGSRPLGAAVRERLGGRREVESFEEEVWFERFPRRFEPQDPLFGEQWHIENTGQLNGRLQADARARPAWDGGWLGEGVTIAIVDTGTEFRHPDLEANWLTGSGYDYNDNDSDPSPGSATDRHGTAVAGIAAAVANGIGVVGVAPAAKFVPLRLIAGSYRSGQEAEALSYRRQDVAIYNNSWGPSDSGGVRYSDSSTALKDALAANVESGRGGRGNIYVWAAGNGGLNRDNSNYDGYNALPFTISVGAVGDDDIKTGYSEPGANLLVVAPSGGRGAGIRTTDNTGASGYVAGDYYSGFNGTSAAAPIVSGVVALMLQARPELGWRDVQQVLARSAVPVDLTGGSWVRNAAGLWVSHDYGFGRVDAAAATALARDWALLPPLRKTGAINRTVGQPLTRGSVVESTLTVGHPYRVEFVRIRVQLNFTNWGDLHIELESPTGTRSVLAEPFQSGTASVQPGTWTYLSMRHLDELAAGTWRLRIRNDGASASGTFLNWGLDIWGHEAELSPIPRLPLADILIDSAEFPIEVDVLAGAVDALGQPLSIASVQLPAFGELSELGNGIFRYNMGVSEAGLDAFSVLLSDGRGGLQRRVVQIRDPRPIARADTFVVASGQTLVLPVLHNDEDPNGDPIGITAFSAPSAGAVRQLADGQLEFSAPAQGRGIARFRYRISDGVDGTAEAPVSVVYETQPDVALDFDGIADHVLVPAATGAFLQDGFTAEAWIYARDWGEYVTGFGRIFDNNSFLLFLNGVDHEFYNDRSLVAYFVTADNRAIAFNSAGDQLQLGRWHHVAVTFDSSDRSVPVRLYIDGREVPGTYPLENTNPPLRPVVNEQVFPLYIGESANGARAFNGKITEVRIWNRLRSAGEILLDHDRRLSGSEPGLQVYFPFNDTVLALTQSAGTWSGQAELLGPRRVPRLNPLRAFERSFNLGPDTQTGWRQDATIGWVFGDQFPWIFWWPLGWVYAGHGQGSAVYYLYPAANDWGWLATAPGTFPWLVRLAGPEWLLQYASGAEALFYFPDRGLALDGRGLIGP